MILLGTYFLGSTYLGLSASHIYRFRSLTKFEEFQLLFLQKLFQLYFPPLPSRTITYVILPQDPASVHFCQSIFFLLFRFDQFYYSVFKFTNSPSVIYTLLLSPFGEFSISHTIFLYRFHQSHFIICISLIIFSIFLFQGNL